MFANLKFAQRLVNSLHSRSNDLPRGSEHKASQLWVATLPAHQRWPSAYLKEKASVQIRWAQMRGSVSQAQASGFVWSVNVAPVFPFCAFETPVLLVLIDGGDERDQSGWPNERRSRPVSVKQPWNLSPPGGTRAPVRRLMARAALPTPHTQTHTHSLIINHSSDSSVRGEIPPHDRFSF